MTAPSDHRDGPRQEVTVGSVVGEDSGPAVTRDVLTLAEALAERVLAVLDAPPTDLPAWADRIQTMDRERVVSDLAGLRAHPVRPRSGFPTPACGACLRFDWPCPDAQRYLDGLRRTAALYGISS